MRAAALQACDRRRRPRYRSPALVGDDAHSSFDPAFSTSGHLPARQVQSWREELKKLCFVVDP
jgi:hypothetical protein